MYKTKSNYQYFMSLLFAVFTVILPAFVSSTEPENDSVIVITLDDLKPLSEEAAVEEMAHIRKHFIDLEEYYKKNVVQHEAKFTSATAIQDLPYMVGGDQYFERGAMKIYNMQQEINGKKQVNYSPKFLQEFSRRLYNELINYPNSVSAIQEQVVTENVYADKWLDFLLLMLDDMSVAGEITNNMLVEKIDKRFNEGSVPRPPNVYSFDRIVLKRIEFLAQILEDRKADALNITIQKQPPPSPPSVEQP